MDSYRRREHRAGRYLMTATFVPNSDVAAVRQAVSALRAQVPSWRHMSKVDEQLKVRITNLIADCGERAHTIVYDAGGSLTRAAQRGQRAKRDACLTALAAEIAGRNGDVQFRHLVPLDLKVEHRPEPGLRGGLVVASTESSTEQNTVMKTSEPGKSALTLAATRCHAA
jgi:hypothetical protein